MERPVGLIIRFFCKSYYTGGLFTRLFWPPWTVGVACRCNDVAAERRLGASGSCAPWRFVVEVTVSSWLRVHNCCFGGEPSPFPSGHNVTLRGMAVFAFDWVAKFTVMVQSHRNTTVFNDVSRAMLLVLRVAHAACCAEDLC